MSVGGLTQAASTTSSPFVRLPPGTAGRREGGASLPGARPGGSALRIADVTFARAVREGAYRVGDACLVWRVVDGGRRLEPCATHHREHRLTHALGAFLDQDLLAPDSHWPGQVTWHGAPVRLRAVRLLDLGIDTAVGLSRAHALIVPVLAAGTPIAIVAALRDTREIPYTLRDEVILRRIAAKTARIAALGARREDDGGERSYDHEYDDRDGDRRDVDAGDGHPPFEGPGWAPPPSWLMDHVDVGVWITDRDGLTTYVNNAMTELLGVPSPKVLGRPLHDFVDDIPHTMLGEFGLHRERCDRRVTLPDGRIAWFGMTSSPLVDDEGRRRGTISTVIDVTDRKQVELSARRRVPRAHRRT
jgi:PAS domain S-box-containing protein